VESGGRKVRVRRLGNGRAGEIKLTRFPRNDAVTTEEMLAEAASRTAERCLGGWTGYYGKPGPIITLNGWLEFQVMKRGVDLLSGRFQGYG
jgi:hypothetical protein